MLQLLKKISIAVLFASTGVAAQISDRLVLEINNTPYTQRQVEIYSLVKAALDAKPGTTVAVTDAKNWQDHLEGFRRDMLIEQEASRLGGFNTTEQMQQKAAEIYVQKTAGNAAVKAAAERLALSPAGVARILATVLRVEGLRRSKQRQDAINDSSTTRQQRQNSEDTAWLDDLANRASIRYYKGALSYETIAFPGN